MVSKKGIIILIIVLGTIGAIIEYNVFNVGEMLLGGFGTSLITSQRPKCVDSFILLDFNDLPPLINSTITFTGTYPAELDGIMSREEMDKYRFTMTVGEVYFPHNVYSLIAKTFSYTSEHRYLGGGVICEIKRYFDPDYVKESKLHLSVGGGWLYGGYNFWYDGPMGLRMISTVVYEVLPRMIVFKVVQIREDDYPQVGRWWDT